MGAIVTLILLLVFSREVSAAEEQSISVTSDAANRCISVNLVRDRYVLDPRRLVIWTRTTPFLIMLGRAIPELTQGHNSISLIDGDHDGELCANLKDGIFLEDMLMPKATNIVRVIQLNSAQLKRLEQTYNKSLQRRPRGLWNRKPPSRSDEGAKP